MDIFTPIMVLAGAMALMCVVPAVFDRVTNSGRRHKGWQR